MNRLGSLNNTQKTSGLTIIYDLFPEGIPSFSMRIKVPNVANNQSTYGFVILSERSESKDLLRSPSSTVKSPERSFDCALRAPLRMTYVSVIPAFTVFGLLIRIVNCQFICIQYRINSPFPGIPGKGLLIWWAAPR